MQNGKRCMYHNVVGNLHLAMVDSTLFIVVGNETTKEVLDAFISGGQKIQIAKSNL